MQRDHIRVALVDHNLGFADVIERKSHIVPTVPIHGLMGVIQFVPLRRGDFVDLITAQRQLIGVELNDAGVVGDSRGVITAVDLLECDGRTLERVAVLGVDLADGQRLLGGILDCYIIGPSRKDGDVNRIGDSVAGRGLGLGQGILHIWLQTGPKDIAARVGRAGYAAAIGAAQSKLRAFQRLAAAPNLGDLQVAGLRLIAAPLDHGVRGEGALAWIGDDIALLGGNGVMSEVDLVSAWKPYP